MIKALFLNETRGHANHGWLDSYHTFSFARYYNPERMNFGMLRVLNDDVVKGGAGFGAHSHEQMEIISIPLYGTLQHQDSTGTQGIIKAGDVQLMSAGSGIVHSEMNASKEDSVNFLQIWVIPKSKNTPPRYEQKTFLAAERENKIQTLVSPDGTGLRINQDAWFHRCDLKQDLSIHYALKTSHNGLFLMVLEGSVMLAEHHLKRRDAIGLSAFEKILITATENAELLLIEVPMK